MTQPTAPALAREHVDGLFVLLRGNLPPAPAPPAVQVRVYDADALVDAAGKPPAAPYAVLYPDPGWPEGTLGDRWRWLLLGFQVTGVGATRRQAQWVADWARGVLLTQQPVVPGRVVHPLWQQEGSPPIDRDDDVSPPLFYAPVLYQMRSVPA